MITVERCHLCSFFTLCCKSFISLASNYFRMHYVHALDPNVDHNPILNKLFFGISLTFLGLFSHTRELTCTTAECNVASANLKFTESALTVQLLRHCNGNCCLHVVQWHCRIECYAVWSRHPFDQFMNI